MQKEYTTSIALPIDGATFSPSTPPRCGGGWPAKTGVTVGGAHGINGRCSWIDVCGCFQSLLWAFSGGGGCESDACERVWLKPVIIMGPFNQRTGKERTVMHDENNVKCFIELRSQGWLHVHLMTSCRGAVA